MANAKVNGRREFTREFKVAAVKLVTEQGYSVAEAARRLGVRENLLRRWKAQLATQGAKAFSGHGVPVVLDDELARLRAENKRLTMERDILKKARPANLTGWGCEARLIDCRATRRASRTHG